jgi:hypothetical protein
MRIIEGTSKEIAAYELALKDGKESKSVVDNPMVLGCSVESLSEYLKSALIKERKRDYSHI